MSSKKVGDGNQDKKDSLINLNLKYFEEKKNLKKQYYDKI